MAAPFKKTGAALHTEYVVETAKKTRPGVEDTEEQRWLEKDREIRTVGRPLVKNTQAPWKGEQILV